ncbi:Protein M04C9.3 b [Aphelenchoides avenae]|nr:Protein M04C9.3 b [Aphelenchus avenae]
MTKPKIVVTGYGPFGSYEDNPSSEIVQRLSSFDDLKEHADLVTELIAVDYTEAEECACKANKELKSGFVIHVGVHPVSRCVKLEQQSFSHGYCGVDVNGKVPLMNCCRLETSEEPTVLRSFLDCESLAKDVSDAVQNDEVSVVSSSNPGRYLCAYIYYCSLLLSGGRALFVHVPEFDEASTPELITNILREIILGVAKRIKNQ